MEVESQQAAWLAVTNWVGPQAGLKNFSKDGVGVSLGLS